MITSLRHKSYLVYFLALILVLSACNDQMSTTRDTQSRISRLSAILSRINSAIDSSYISDSVIRFSYPRQEIKGDKLVLGGTFTLSQGQVLDGNLFILGGTATLEEQSVVKGDVIVMGGMLVVRGTVEGDINVVGGLVTLNSKALVEGDINALGGNLAQDAGAQVEGDINKDLAESLPFLIPGRIQIPNWGGWSPVEPGNLRLPQFDISLNPLWDGLWLLFRSFIWAVLAVLVVLFLPKHSERAAEVAVSQPIVSGGLGCLTLAVAPLFLILLVITICGIPISMIGATILMVAWVFGIIVLGMESGRRLTLLMKQDWALPVSTALGTFTLTLVINSLETIVPCVGWLGPAIVGVIGLGAVLLTRFGSKNYPPGSLTGTELRSESLSESLSSDLPQPQPSQEVDVPSKDSDS